MNETPEEGLQNHVKFSDLEPKIETFFKTFNTHPYRVHESLYGFEEEAFGEIIPLLHACKLPRTYHSYKDVICEKLCEKLGFGNNDLVFFAEGGIYAKLFFQIQTPQDTADRRACGLSNELLETYKKKFFPHNEHKTLILELLPHVVENVLSFKKVSPARFKKLFIPALVNLVEIIVVERTKLDDLRSIRGITYFLLREIFDELMLFIAEDILFHFSNADKKAIEFLSFFSVHESIDAQGNRYKPNPILDESNHAWNITTIRSTMLQHKKAKQALYDKKNALIGIKKKLDTYRIEQKELYQQAMNSKEALTALEEKVLAIHKTLQKLQETEATEVKFTENGEEKTFQRSVLLAKLFKKEDGFLKEKISLRRTFDEMEAKLSNKQKEIDLWEKKYTEGKEILSSIEANGHPMDKQYERIQRALAKTLASR